MQTKVCRARTKGRRRTSNKGLRNEESHHPNRRVDRRVIDKFGDGTVTNASWKAKAFSKGPIDRDAKNPRVENIPIPESWYAIDFDDSSWGKAKEYTEEEVGPKQPFFEYDFKGAKFIWSDDIDLDNTVLFRHVVKSPPDGKPRVDYSNLNKVVPDGPPKRPKR